MMKNSQTWIKEIEDSISNLKLKGRKWYYQINAEMTIQTMNIIESHFRERGYITDCRPCNSCKNSADLIIGWNE